MARIRSIKPEFWSDEKLAPLDPLDRLVFLGLISQADCAGRIIDNMKMIDAFIFPRTDHTASPSLETLESLGRICRYRTTNGQDCIQIINWSRHQKIDNPAKNLLPAPSPEDIMTSQDMKSSRESRESNATDSRDPRGGSRIKDLGSSTGTEDQEDAAGNSAAAIKRLWDYWVRLWGLGDSRVSLTTKRRKAIRNRLAEFTPEEIASAFRGYRRDLWWGVEWSRSKVEKVCGSREMVEQGIEWDKAPRNGATAKSRDQERQERMLENIRKAQEADDAVAKDVQRGHGRDGGGLWAGVEPREAQNLLGGPQG